ncbi:aldehyde dehydrogenase family protein [Undibacterium arcticum]
MTTTMAHPAQGNNERLRNKMLISGEWTDAESGNTLPVYNPATGEQIAAVPDAGPADIDRAVTSAAQTFASSQWRAMQPAARERIFAQTR